MIEVLFFVFVVLFLIVLFFYSGLLSDRALALELENKVASARERLKIAERRFMHGKIKKNVFELLVDSIEEELLSAEMGLFRLAKINDISISAKTEEVFLQVNKPTRHRKAKVEALLKETELIRKELSMLEAKFMRREINQNVFDRLVMKKEAELIEKEHQLTKIAAE
jgi:hypothetical protein